MIFAPYFTLGLNRVACQLPGVNAHHAVDPGGGHAPFGEDHLDLEKGARVHFIATERPRLQGPQQPCRFQLGNRFVRDLELAITLCRAFAQRRQQAPRALQQFDFVLSLFSHAVHPVCSPNLVAPMREP
ncbi:hypothetical protein D3C79_714320 [compost metagenome]|nr:hypothetical protein [Pseudomonas sp. Hg5Tf]MDH2558739.1 hypothetical protein [Pseudomonas sp. Hg5Tf]